MEWRASIIIPAHNEERRIRHLLEVLVEASRTERYAIFVICNGCTDRTRQVAEEYEGVRVVEIENIGKHFALNEGDRLAGDIFPRLYCDADVGIDAGSLLRLVERLTTDVSIAVGPEVRYGVEGRSWGVKQYFKALETPLMAEWLDEKLMGRGVYGASREARKRFGEFPPLYADDDFFNAQYADTEKVVVQSAVVTIWTPTTLRELLKTETRVALGNRQFDAFLEEGMNARGVDVTVSEISRGGFVKRLGTLRQWTRSLRPSDYLPLAMYLFVVGMTRIYLALHKLGRQKVAWR
jgi:glycosyltransferase involved in cell wall biosynthesis